VQLPDVGLSVRGRSQAARLAARLAAAGIARIRTSDLVRALETAEVLRAATGAPMDEVHAPPHRLRDPPRGRASRRRAV